MARSKRPPSPEESGSSGSGAIDDNSEKDEGNESAGGSGDASDEDVESGNEGANMGEGEGDGEEEEEEEEEEDPEEGNVEDENMEEANPEEEVLKEEKQEDGGKLCEEAGQKEVAVEEERAEQAVLKHVQSSARANKGFPDFDALIFMCNSTTMIDCFKYGVFGLPDHKKHTVEQIRKGMRLFLYNIETKLLYGIFRAATPGGYRLEADAFRGSRKTFPWQVRFFVYKDCLPLKEYLFRDAIIENYDESRKFKIELTGQQAQKLTKLFQPVAKGESFLPKVPKPQPQIAVQNEYAETYQSVIPEPEWNTPTKGRDSLVVVPKETKEHEIPVQVESPEHNSPREEHQLAVPKTSGDLSSLTSNQHMGSSWPESTVPKASFQDQLAVPQFQDRQDPSLIAHPRQVTHELHPLEESRYLRHSSAAATLLDPGLSLNSIRDRNAAIMNLPPVSGALYRSNLEPFNPYQIGANDALSLRLHGNPPGVPIREADHYRSTAAMNSPPAGSALYRSSLDLFKADLYQTGAKDGLSLHQRHSFGNPSLQPHSYQQPKLKDAFSLHQDRNPTGIPSLDTEPYQHQSSKDVFSRLQQRNALGVLTPEPYQQQSSKDVLPLRQHGIHVGVSNLEADPYQYRNSKEVFSLHQRNPLGADPYQERNAGIGSLYRHDLQALSDARVDNRSRSYHHDPLADLPPNLAGVSNVGKRPYQAAFPSDYTSRPLSRQFMQEDYASKYQKMHSEETAGGAFFGQTAPADKIPGFLQYSRIPPPARPYGRGLW